MVRLGFGASLGSAGASTAVFVLVPGRGDNEGRTNIQSNGDSDILYIYIYIHISNIYIYILTMINMVIPKITRYGDSEI